MLLYSKQSLQMYYKSFALLNVYWVKISAKLGIQMRLLY